ncbi:NAD(P)-dependent oxidoreductase [Georgenia sp. SYP-B2076]|uniref:NAD-dependent epimerase/dehydratase family protein n=1 Tax=Georgenia sp. SYP-B2076 TaxID=2495881 RepID=UPI0013E01591|nr:NAD(P)-dependent oxidoreductase [Georgenia sp. SYP-B2076]
METVLVTGGSGMLGSAVAAGLVRAGHQAVVFDQRINEQNIGSIRDLVTLIQGDVCDRGQLAAVVTEHRVTRIIHLAALLSVHVQADPDRGLRVNALGTNNVFDVATRLGVERVVWASTAAVYGRKHHYEELVGRGGAMSETDAPTPRDIYSATKLLCELLAQRYAAEGLDVVGLRPVTTYGLGLQTGAVGELLAAIGEASEGRTGHVGKYWSEDAHINPIFAVDCASQFIETCLHPKPLQQPIYNTGTGEYVTIGQMMRVATELTGAPILFDQQVGDMEVFDCVDCDSTALREELGWEAQYDLRTAVEACIAEFRRTAREAA